MPRHGATTNALSDRFGDPVRSADGDWLDHATAHEDLPPLRVTVTEEHPKTVLTRNESPDIPFDRSFNAYRGCEHGCIYCFARPTHAWLSLSPGLDFETRLYAKPTGPMLLRRAFAAKGYRVKPLAMGTNTDPYQPIEGRYRITRAVLELCLETRHPVSITTKSARILDDLPLLKALAAQRLAMAMLSVTTLDPDLARAMEPRAPTPRLRLAAIRALAEAGVPVAVSASPMIPGLNDHELEAILAAAADAGAGAAAALPLRLPHEVAPLFEAWLETHAPDRKAKVMNGVTAMRGGRRNDPRFGRRMKGTGEWARLLGLRLTAARKRHGLDQRRWDLDCSRFEAPPGDPDQGRLL